MKRKRAANVTFPEALALHALAKDIAREACEDNFRSRRGSGVLEPRRGRMAGFYLYDNNPYDDDLVRPLDADGTRRAREHAEIINAMSARGCILAARASYPNDDDDDQGYTVALVFVSASPEMAEADLLAARERWREAMDRAASEANRHTRLADAALAKAIASASKGGAR